MTVEYGLLALAVLALLAAAGIALWTHLRAHETDPYPVCRL